MIPGYGLCVMVVARSYPPTGGGYMVRYVKQTLLAEDQENGEKPPWTYELKTTHATKQRTCKCATAQKPSCTAKTALTAIP